MGVSHCLTPWVHGGRTWLQALLLTPFGANSATLMPSHGGGNTPFGIYDSTGIAHNHWLLHSE